MDVNESMGCKILHGRVECDWIRHCGTQYTYSWPPGEYRFLEVKQRDRKPVQTGEIECTVDTSCLSLPRTSLTAQRASRQYSCHGGRLNEDEFGTYTSPSSA